MDKSLIIGLDSEKSIRETTTGGASRAVVPPFPVGTNFLGKPNLWFQSIQKVTRMKIVFFTVKINV
ncbi:hypothetical protein DAT1711_23980 [Enterococcus cecorum]